KPSPPITPAPKPTPRVAPPSPPSPVANLPDLPCSKLTKQKESGRVKISGFVGSDQDLMNLKNIFPAKMTDIDVQVRPWPQCEVLLTLEKQLSADHKPAVTIAGGKTTLKSGTEFVIQVAAPDRAAFMYVSYVQADGTVVNLVQPFTSPPSPMPPHTT